MEVPLGIEALCELAVGARPTSLDLAHSRLLDGLRLRRAHPLATCVTEVELVSVHLLKLVLRPRPLSHLPLIQVRPRGQLFGEVTGTELILPTFGLGSDFVDFLRDEAWD